MPALKRIVVIGAGHGGVEFCEAMRAADPEASITLLDSHAHQPYQRPPLSKDGLEESDAAAAPLPLRSDTFFEDPNLALRLGVQVESIDRAAQVVRCSDGSALAYDHLVLATGGACAPGPFSDNQVLRLHTASDAERVRAALSKAEHLAVIGAGFIGLEIASAARARGIHVSLIAPSSRILSRGASPSLSAALAARHASNGIDLRLGAAVAEVRTAPGAPGAGYRLTLSDGSRIDADTVVAGIGIRPRTRLAEECGLEVDNGIVVDQRLRTSDPAISAIGDCAAFPSAIDGTLTRLESVQNAVNHARHLAETLGDSASQYREVPWFWSVQGEHRVQMVGQVHPEDTTVTLGEPHDGPFTALHFRDDQLNAVETINAPAVHISARRLLSGPSVAHAELERNGFDLRAYSRSLRSAA